MYPLEFRGVELPIPNLEGEQIQTVTDESKVVDGYGGSLNL